MFQAARICFFPPSQWQLNSPWIVVPGIVAPGFVAAASEGNVSMATGTVKWFNDSKGYGFITPSEGGEDLFAHHTAIQMAGFKTLKEGQKVEFEVKRGPKGLQAANIKPL
jgi:cold shock protein